MKTSIIIPTMNAKPEWLAKALGSCSFADEIIITRREGLTQAVNDAVNIARGRWIAILPDDDFFLPEIEKIVDRLSDSEADVVYFPCQHYIEEMPLEGLHDTDQEKTIYGSCFMKRETFISCGGYDGERCQDQRLFGKMREAGAQFEYVPIAGGVFRWNSHSKLQHAMGGCSKGMR